MQVKITNFVRKLLTTSLGRGSIVMVGGSFLVGAISFVFNPVMGVLLGPAGYGELLSLLSLLTIFSVPSLTLNAILVKMTANFQASNDLARIKSLFFWITQKFILVSLAIIILFWLFSPSLAKFLNVGQTTPIILLGFLTIVTFLFTINGAFLQGLLKFEVYTFANLLNSILRIGFALLLVRLGLYVGGALGALILALLFAYMVGWLKLYRILGPIKTTKVNRREILQFALPAFLSTLGLTLLNNIDIVLVKHFFSPVEAGLYGAGVITSRVVVFASLPITQVIFPLVTQRAESKKNFHHLLQIALGLIVAIGLITTLVYFFFPTLVLKLFFLNKSGQYLGALGLLGPFSLVVTFYSINTLLTYFFLSLHKAKFALAPLLVSIAETILIWFYHPSLIAVIWVAMVTNVILTIALLYYYWQVKKA